MNKKAININRHFLIAGILCFAYYLEMGIFIRFGQSLLFLWPVIGAILIARWALWKRAFKAGKPTPFPKWFLIIERTVVIIFLVYFVAVESLIVSSSFASAPDGLDAVIVLGARVNSDGPSGSLNERIETAAKYLNENPGTLCIASGGQGSDEPQSEAECIKDHLLALGIGANRIIVEDASTSTEENLVNSFGILGASASRVGIVTNDFHVYRAVSTGNIIGGYELYGISAKSSIVGYIHYALREFCALTVSWITGELPLPV